MLSSILLKKALIIFSQVIFGHQVLSADLFSPALAQDSGQASVILAKKYLIGKGVPRDNAKAVALLNEAADKGNIEATADLGSIYYLGRLAPRDLAKAYKLTNIAASKGNSKAIYTLGEMYLRGEGVQKNSSKAISLLMQATAQGDNYALIRIGHMYKNAEVTTAEHNKAAEYFKKKQPLNDVWTMYDLGLFYAYSGDFHESAKWFTKSDKIKSISLPFPSVCSSFHLGIFYAEGKGVEKNLNTANSLLVTTAKNIIKYNDELKIVDFNLDKINSRDLSNAFAQNVSQVRTHRYSQTIKDSAAKMVNEIAGICSYP